MRTTARPFCFTLLVSLLSIATAWGETISGRIVDPDNRAVPGATVILLNAGSVLATTVTDSAGTFTIEASHPGPFDLRASADGTRIAN